MELLSQPRNSAGSPEAAQARKDMAVSLFARVSRYFLQRNGNTFYSVITRESSFKVGPRKLTFGKKTDLELLVKMMKLERHDKFVSLGATPSSPCVELLANACEDMDYKMIRNRQPFFLHYRVDLLLQRVKFMETLKFTPRQKRREVEQSPSVLMLSFTSEDYLVNYLRGLIYCGNNVHGKSEFVHLLYQCCPRFISSYSFKIEQNLSIICKELGITEERALKMAVNMPCFLLWNIEKALEKFHLIHRDYGLPFGYNLDLHTAAIFPPVLQQSSKISYNLLTNKPDQQLVQSLKHFSLCDVLEYGFSLQGGQGKPEDLSAFLIANSRAEGANENSDLQE